MTLLAIVAIHTAANEPPKVRQVMNKIHRNVGPRRSRRRGRGRQRRGRDADARLLDAALQRLCLPNALDRACMEASSPHILAGLQQELRTAGGRAKE